MDHDEVVLAYEYYLKHWRYAHLPSPMEIGSVKLVPFAVRYPEARAYPQPVPVKKRNQTRRHYSFTGINCEDDEGSILKRPRNDDLGQSCLDNSNPSPTAGTKAEAVAQMQDEGSTLRCPPQGEDHDESSVDNPSPAGAANSSPSSGSN